MKIGFEIKKTWNNSAKNYYGSDPVALNLLEDSQILCTELFDVLKDFCLLPKLRKENLYVETNLNTIHQTYMYDFLYDQQDVYDYYTEIFEVRNNSLYKSSIPVRQDCLPFSSALENFDEIFFHFSTENEINLLANIRWYSSSDGGILEEKENFFSNKYSTTNDNISSISSTAQSYSYKKLNPFPNMNLNINTHHNPLLSLLNSFTLAINFFCTMSFDVIYSHSVDDRLFLDCFLKIYKAYVTAAIHLNDSYENLNVLVNYIYEGLFKESPKSPKFSIYRLMIVVWHRLVTIPLTDLNKEKNLLETSLKLLKNFIAKDFEKTNESQYNFKFFKSRSDPPEDFSRIKTIELDFMSDDEVSASIMNDIQRTNHHSNFSFGMEYIKSSGMNEKYDLDMDRNDSPDQQVQYFLEQIPSVFLDVISNEFSTFHINDSNFPISHLYQVYEKNLLKSIEKFVKNKLKKIDALSILNYFRNSEFFSRKIINRTRKVIYESITSLILNHCQSEISCQFISFLNSYTFVNEESSRDRDMFFKAFDLSEERKNMFFLDFYQISMKEFRDHSIAEYATLYFIRELIRGKNSLFFTLNETLQFQKEEKENLDYIDKHVRKENKRRNILLKDNENYEEQLFNFNTNLSFSHINEIFNHNIQINQISPMDLGLTKNGKNDMFMHNPIEDLPTLPQSLDIDMKLYENLMDVEDNNSYLVSFNNR